MTTVHFSKQSHILTEDNSTDALRLEHETILEAAGEGIIKASPDGIIHYANAKACKMLSIDKQTIKNNLI